ncbi:tRNA (adenosine(37)-N6)-threonylcarbamoyltransferase complex dimerization subunit type 1 TsaB [Flavobacteriaceae bacterium S356]|uniref:tRNA (Adenosine(37)-N6)-threonylcarbamoyltransferase complex dimerization subunit type 1 TsaB n=1 Tax=Asprobacillus argus TaxID=3076534 RepID=A0ABU3LG87_9FLAO|nr:tRNA (adenosine(37)-N6)-threonylcarbamoyltransferase complex dimerization subunit type 1 TsaB [Flavobacteriaceae bacterium S356]
MAIILNIETSTKNCSVSIADNGKIIALKELVDMKYSHAEKLHPFISEVTKEANIELSQIDAVAVSKGPGSYTGLRIGVSAAKGLAFAFNIPLISVNTLKSLAMSIQFDTGVVISMLDARRMEVYSAVFDASFEEVRAIEAEIIDENSFQEYLEEGKVHFLGDGAQKCKEIITHSNAIFIDDKFPSAREMAALSYHKYEQNDMEDVAYFEPFYLKDFIANKEKKKL